MLLRRRHTVGSQFIHDLSLLSLDQEVVVLVSGHSTAEKAACHAPKPYHLPGLITVAPLLLAACLWKYWPLPHWLYIPTAIHSVSW